MCDATVAGVSLPPDESQLPLFDLIRDPVSFKESHFHDIRDTDFMQQTVSRFKPDLILHLAAQSLVRRSYDEPIETFDVNVRGTASVLEAVRKNETPAVICVTTDKCYENTEQIWPYRESDPLGGWDPYSASKGASELVVQSYRRSYFAPDGLTACASARAGNVIGGGDLAADRLVPDLYRAMEQGVPLTLRNPQAVRPWQHVLEALSGYLLLGAALLDSGTAFAEAWNFGPDPSEHITVGQFAAHLGNALGDGAPATDVKAGGPHEAHHLTLDVTKARRRLGWVPILTIEERVGLTADWMRRHLSNRLEPAVVFDQINKFERRWAS